MALEHNCSWEMNKYKNFMYPAKAHRQSALAVTPDYMSTEPQVCRSTLYLHPKDGMVKHMVWQLMQEIADGRWVVASIPIPGGRSLHPVKNKKGKFW